MTKLKTFIVDDEEDGILAIKILLNELFDSKVEIIGSAKGIDEAKVKLSKSSIDLLFLDINLSKGSGFDLLDQLEEKNFEVIFVTAHEEYALKAFKHLALSYLLKPINISDFKKVVNKVVDQNEKTAVNLSEVVNYVRNSNNSKIGIPNGKRIEFVDPNEIVYIKADGSYSKVFLINQKSFIVSKNLKMLESSVAPFGLLRVHNSVIVNPNEILRFDKTNGNILFMSDGSEIAVSKSYKHVLTDLIKSWGIL